MVKEIKPYTERIYIKRKYNNVYALLRELFRIPNNEMVVDFYWDKKNGELVLETLKD